MNETYEFEGMNVGSEPHFDRCAELEEELRRTKRKLKKLKKKGNKGKKAKKLKRKIAQLEKKMDRLDEAVRWSPAPASNSCWEAFLSHSAPEALALVTELVKRMPARRGETMALPDRRR